MNLSFDNWFDIIILIIPFVGTGIKWIFCRIWGKKNRALSIEYTDGKLYTRKKNDKVELKVIYNKTVACDALVTLRIAIKNTGKEDIAKSSLVDPIKLTFDNKYDILDVSKVQQYDKIKPSIQYTANDVYVSWALLKHSDKFEIDIIAKKKSDIDTKESAIDFYNTMSYDLNIDGIDKLVFEKKITAKERALKKSRNKIWFFGIYAILFASFAFVSKSRPDNDYRLILQNDSTLVESSVLVYSKIDIVEIKEFDKKLSIDEFNTEYQISGLSHEVINTSFILFVIYLAAAICSLLVVSLLLVVYFQQKEKLKVK